ncbi:MAG: DUF4139 domain-containing protein, partial [Candidatus Omnitrophica bacterium]|nr:DUF4139 domain-containing protein [Candidatus Omnitrophota bacterium]
SCSYAQEGAANKAENIQTDLVIYNNTAMIKDSYKVSLHKGDGVFKLDNFPENIVPESVYISFDNEPIVIKEQNFQQKAINQNNILKEYVGKNIKIMNINEYSGNKEIIDAELVSIQGGEIYKINNEIYLGYPGYKIVPVVPSELSGTSFLEWKYFAKKDIEDGLSLYYLSGGLTWKADYIVTLNDNEKTADIICWATVNNNTGAAFNNAGLKLVAGSPNVATPRNMYATRSNKMMMSAEMVSDDIAPMSMSDYYVYDIPSRTELPVFSSKQIPLINQQNAGIEKEYRITNQRNYYSTSYNGDAQKNPVSIYVKIINSEKNGLGMPFPAGEMRFYAEEGEQTFFLGEGNIGHTPKDEKIELEVGKAFDVLSETKQIKFDQISKNITESSWQITISNHKKETVKVKAIESFQADWEITSKNHPYEKLDSNRAAFTAELKPDETKVIEFTVKTRFQ